MSAVEVEPTLFEFDTSSVFDPAATSVVPTMWSTERAGASSLEGFFDPLHRWIFLVLSV